MLFKQNKNRETYGMLEILIKMLYVVVGIAPFLLTLINTGAYIFAYRHAKQYLIVFYLFTFLMLFFAFLCINKLPERESKDQKIYIDSVVCNDNFFKSSSNVNYEITTGF